MTMAQQPPRPRIALEDLVLLSLAACRRMSAAFRANLVLLSLGACRRMSAAFRAMAAATRITLRALA